MKRSAQFGKLCILLCCVLSALYLPAATAATHDLAAAVKGHQLTAEFFGLGKCAGNSISARMTNNTAGPITITFAPGVILLPNDSRYSRMALRRVTGRLTAEGEYVSATGLTLAPTASLTFLFAAYSLDFDKENPTQQTTFSLGPVEAKVKAVLEAATRAQLSTAAVQAAIWIKAMGVAPEQVGRRISISEAELSAAKSLVVAPPPAATARPTLESRSRDDAPGAAGVTKRPATETKSAKSAAPRQQAEGAAVADKTELGWRIFRHLVPQGVPPNATVTIEASATAGNQAAPGRLRVHVRPQVEEMGSRILADFGAPGKIEKGTERDFLSPQGSIPNYSPKRVKGDLWTYGSVSLLVQEGTVRYIWLSEVPPDSSTAGVKEAPPSGPSPSAAARSALDQLEAHAGKYASLVAARKEKLGQATEVLQRAANAFVSGDYSSASYSNETSRRYMAEAVALDGPIAQELRAIVDALRDASPLVRRRAAELLYSIAVKIDPEQTFEWNYFRETSAQSALREQLARESDAAAREAEKTAADYIEKYYRKAAGAERT